MSSDAQRLDDLLDFIETQKKKIKADTETSDDNDLKRESLPDSSSSYTWSKHFDVNVQMFYYFNHKTKVSQWEKPLLFEDVPTASVSSSVTAHASFNSREKSFSVAGQDTYFEKVGRENDRAGTHIL